MLVWQPVLVARQAVKNLAQGLRPQPRDMFRSYGSWAMLGRGLLFIFKFIASRGNMLVWQPVLVAG